MQPLRPASNIPQRLPRRVRAEIEARIDADFVAVVGDPDTAAKWADRYATLDRTLATLASARRALESYQRLFPRSGACVPLSPEESALKGAVGAAVGAWIIAERELEHAPQPIADFMAGRWVTLPDGRYVSRLCRWAGEGSHPLPSARYWQWAQARLMDLATSGRLVGRDRGAHGPFVTSPATTVSRMIYVCGGDALGALRWALNQIHAGRTDVDMLRAGVSGGALVATLTRAA